MLILERSRCDLDVDGFMLVCESSLKQESFRRHVDRVFENYLFSRDAKINMATKAILYNCLTCEGDFSYDFNHKVWIRDTTDRYALNEALRKFNKILHHDRRFRGRTSWIAKNVKEYFNEKLVRKYYALKDDNNKNGPSKNTQHAEQTKAVSTPAPTPAPQETKAAEPSAPPPGSGDAAPGATAP